MSWQAVTWVLEQSQAVHSSRLVLLSIASHANREGRQSYPSVETICIEARLGRRAVQYCLRELEELGELRTIPRTMNSSSYEMPFVEKWLKSMEGAQSLRPGGAQKSAAQGRKNRPKGAHTRAHEPFPNRPIEPSEEKPQENFPVSVLREPSQTISESDEQAEVERLVQGRAVKALGRSKQMERSSKSAAELEAERQRQLIELRNKGYLPESERGVADSRFAGHDLRQ